MELKRRTPAPDYNFLALEEMYSRHSSRKVLVAILTSLVLLILVVLLIATQAML